MTKEQLEELIEQKGTVYDIDGFEIELYSKDKCHIVPTYDGKNDYLVVRYANGARYVPVSQLIDKEQYEWRQKTVAEHTEWFEPPMWKDLIEKDLYVFTFVKDGEVYDFICNNYLDKVDIRLEQRLVGYSSKPVTACQFNDATKENYEKACEIVRDLFNKEEK